MSATHKVPYRRSLRVAKSIGESFRRATGNIDGALLVSKVDELAAALPEEVEDGRHAPGYVRAVMEVAASASEADRDDARAFAQHFLNRKPAYSKTSAGNAALRLEAWLITNGGTLYKRFVETVLEQEPKFLAIFEGKLPAEELKKVRAEMEPYLDMDLLVEAGSVDYESGSVLEFTMFDCTGKPPAKGALDKAPNAGDSSAQPPKEFAGDVRLESLLPSTKDEYDRVYEDGGVTREAFAVVVGQDVLDEAVWSDTGYRATDANGVEWVSEDAGYTWVPDVDKLDEAVIRPSREFFQSGGRRGGVSISRDLPTPKPRQKTGPRPTTKEATQAKFKPGDVVTFKGRRGRRYLVVSVDQFGHLSMVALSGSERGSAPSAVQQKEVQLADDQTTGFTGKQRFKLHRRAVQSVMGVGSLVRDGGGIAITQEKIPAVVDEAIFETGEHGALRSPFGSWAIFESPVNGGEGTATIVALPGAQAAWAVEDDLGDLTEAVGGLSQFYGELPAEGDAVLEAFLRDYVEECGTPCDNAQDVCEAIVPTINLIERDGLVRDACRARVNEQGIATSDRDAELFADAVGLGVEKHFRGRFFKADLIASRNGADVHVTFASDDRTDTPERSAKYGKIVVGPFDEMGIYAEPVVTARLVNSRGIGEIDGWQDLQGSLPQVRMRVTNFLNSLGWPTDEAATATAKEPPAVVTKWATQTGMSVGEAMRRYEKAGQLVSKQYPDVKEKSERWYELKVGIFKTMMRKGKGQTFGEGEPDEVDEAKLSAHGRKVLLRVSRQRPPDPDDAATVEWHRYTEAYMTDGTVLRKSDWRSKTTGEFSRARTHGGTWATKGTFKKLLKQGADVARERLEQLRDELKAKGWKIEEDNLRTLVEADDTDEPPAKGKKGDGKPQTDTDGEDPPNPP